MEESDEFADDGEAQACAGVFSCVSLLDLVEFFEDCLLVFLRDARAGVEDGDPYAVYWFAFVVGFWSEWFDPECDEFFAVVVPAVGFDGVASAGEFDGVGE